MLWICRLATPKICSTIDDFWGAYRSDWQIGSIIEIFSLLFFYYLCSVLRPISIATIVLTLCLLFCGESQVCNLELATTPLSAEQTITITDADIPNPTSALSGQCTSRSTTSSSRSLQRNNCKRLGIMAFGLGATDAYIIIESLHHIVKPNILGGVVAKRALYSLCCLRI